MRGHGEAAGASLAPGGGASRALFELVWGSLNVLLMVRALSYMQQIFIFHPGEPLELT